MARLYLSLLVTAVFLSACNTLPSDVPSARTVVGEAGLDQGSATYALVDLTYEVSERVRQAPPTRLTTLAGTSSDDPLDIIGEGDALSISIFDPGGSLFGSRNVSGMPQAGNQTLPTVLVDGTGAVSVPFAGSVRVQGLTPQQASAAIRRALQGRLANPQVIVSVANNVSNSVVVLGEVRTPGRVAIGANADNLLDVIAEAGGASRPVEDILVTVNRDRQSATAPLSAVTTDFDENIRLAKGDQINLVYRPRRFSSFGALGQVSQLSMEAGPLTLAGALARLGGLDTNAADPRSVMLLRFERPEVARALGVNLPVTDRGVPIVYRLDLASSTGFFVANNFLVEPEDIIFAPRSRSAELRKFFEFVQTVTRVVYDVTVTGTLVPN